MPRPLALDITTWVNGEVRQRRSTDQMLFSVPEITETVSASVQVPASRGHRRNPHRTHRASAQQSDLRALTGASASFVSLTHSSVARCRAGAAA
ncbi:fumarylacetoacetate hydrolase family protein [Streptomyces scopuliridis]|uniref:fumarylacetoacetate hydrolase family protein n=1 Tax=Streptomyces scopuliridis TaxID=452529 RepID=UPI00368BA838